MGKRFGFVFLILFAVAFQLFWSAAVIKLLFVFNLFLPSRDFSLSLSKAFTGGSFLVFYAFVEEVCFRFFPLFCSLKISKSFWLIFLAVLTSSFLFGFLHGNVLNIFVQGVGGVVYSIVYLSSGGLEGKHLKALACSTSSHSLFNLVILVLTKSNLVLTV